MNVQETRIGEIKEKVLAFAREWDWEQFHSPKNLSIHARIMNCAFGRVENWEPSVFAVLA